MRPVKRALKMLENPEENTSEKDQVTQTKQVKKISILLRLSITCGPQLTNAFFATVNQMFGGSSQLPTTAERAVIKSNR